MPEKTPRKKPLGGSLFGVIFLIVGVGIVMLSPAQTLFTSIFGVTFAAAGLFVIFVAQRKSSSVGSGHDPIPSTEKHGFWLFGFMALMFIGISSPVLLAIPEEIARDNWLILVALLFPVAGLWLAFMAWKTWRNWHYYGASPLQLDPVPGQIGGDIGGHITLGRRLDKSNWSVTLQCLKIRISGSGKNRSRHETLLWQGDQVPEVQPGPQGTGIRFCFTPPADLPAAKNEGRNQIVWRLVMNGPAEPTPLERTYNLPAVAGTGRSTITLSDAHISHHERKAKVDAITNAAEQIDVQAAGNGLTLHSRAGRNIGMKLMIFIFGLIFTGIGTGLGYMAADEGFMLYVMAALFFLFGFPMLIGGIFIAGRSMSSRIVGDTVIMIRYWCGRPLWQRRGTLSSADQLYLESRITMKQGHQTTEYFSLSVKDGKKTIRLAEGIAGRAVAEAFRDNLIRLLGL